MATHAVAVAYSGGRDSSALLHACASAARALNEDGAALLVHALHVHHGLSGRADAWLAHCRSQCEAWARVGLPIQFHSARLEGRPAAGQSVEAWARDGRYAALTRMAREAGAGLVLLAHHRRDQAETWLLQALRGAGVAGLAAMPRSQRREGIEWARPWLEQPREAIEAYLTRHAIAHVEDDSNLDPRFARNRLRLQVMPVLSRAFEGAERQLARAAGQAQQALELEREIAAEDLARIAVDAGLDVQAWQQLSPARASNALRAWLGDAMGRVAPASLVLRLLAELPGARAGRWPCVAGELHLYRGILSLARPAAPVAVVAEDEQPLDLSAPGRYSLPAWCGALEVTAVAQGGIAADGLRQVRLRARRGGEQFQHGLHGVPRSLKKAFQSAGVAAWERGGPLLFAGEDLLFVPGLGIDGRRLARDAQPQRGLRWLPADETSERAG